MREDAAYALLEQLRWGGAPASCPRCATAGRCYFLAPRGGARVTRTGAPTPRRVWKCGACRGQFSVLAGTALEGTRVPLATWVAFLRGLADGERSPAVLARRHGLAPSTARAMLARAADAGGTAAGADPVVAMLRGAPAARRRRAPVRGGRPVGPLADYG